MKNLNQVINAKSLIVAGVMAALSSMATAETYVVEVELNSSLGENPLVATETQAMNYPVLEVNEATQHGAVCWANGGTNNTGFDGRASTSVNSLCPGAKGLGARVQFSGVPSAVISVERSLLTTELNGVRFAHTDGKSYSDVRNVTLSANEGLTTVGLDSSVILFDRSQVIDAVMEFSYDISASYQ